MSTAMGAITSISERNLGEELRDFTMILVFCCVLGFVGTAGVLPTSTDGESTI
jgi:hypothetical protein